MEYTGFGLSIMKELLNNPGFVALLGTLFGGAGLKIVETWLGKAKQRQDAGAAIRAELRLEIEGLRSQLEKARFEEQRLEALVDKWQGAYYDLRDEKQKVVTELTITLSKLRELQQRLEK